MLSIYRLLLVMAGLGLVGGVVARTPATETKAVDALFAQYAAKDGPGCAVSVASNGRTALERAWGSADLEHDVPNTVDTIFEAGSVSKQFVAAAVLLLAQDGKLSLQDDIRRFVPEMPRYDSAITIEQLITHTSGLRDWGAVEEIAGWPRGTREYTLADILDVAVRQTALNSPAGTKFSYTNTGYNLLVIITSRLTGMSFPEFTRKRLFEPLGMLHTSWRDDFRRVVRNRAIAYSRDEKGPWRQDMPFENGYGNGGMLTTVADLQRWNQALDSKALGDYVTTELQRRAKLADGSDTEYARGLFLRTWRGVDEIGHGGATAGYRTWLGRYPGRRLSIALLCNAGNADTGDLAHEVASVFLPELKVSEPEPPPEPAAPAFEPPAGTDLGAYAGTYRSEEADATYKVSLEGKGLVVRVDRRPEWVRPLLMTGVDAFRSEDETGFRFHRDATGRVTELGVTISRVDDMRFRRVN